MRFRKNHGLGMDEARRRVDKVADALYERYRLACEWRGDKLHVSGTGVDGDIAVAEHDIEVNIRLGFTMMMLKGAIRSAVEDAMDEHF